MAGVHFSFDSFKPLLDLNIGIANRLDENRAESFTLLYCDLEKIAHNDVSEALATALRGSDAIINHGSDYFFILPYTDKYGAEVVKQIFEDIFETDIPYFLLSYPVDGDDSSELFEMLRDSVSTFLKKELPYLDPLTQKD